MIDIPLSTIIQKIQASTELGEEEIKSKIRAKLKELSGLISDEGAAHIIANELGVKLLEAATGSMTINNVMAGMRNVEVVGKVKQVYEVREFNTGERSGKVGNLLLQDPTGIIRIVLWNDQADQMKDLQPGDILKIKGAYAKANNNRKELHLGDRSSVEKNPEGVTVDVDITTQPKAENKRIADLGAQDDNAVVVATIVQVFDPRFFPSKQNPDLMNYVMNIYLDDGSDNIRCVLWSDQIESLLGKSREEILTFQENPASFEAVKNDLLGQIVKIRGRIKNNETFGRLEFVAYDVIKDVKPEDEMPKEDVVKKAESVDAVTEETTVKAEVADDGEVESISVEDKKSFSSGTGEEEELLTLDDIEDLEELDD